MNRFDYVRPATVSEAVAAAAAPGSAYLAAGTNLIDLILRLAPARGDHDWNLGDAELPGGEHPGMARNQPAIPRPPAPASSSPTP